MFERFIALVLLIGLAACSPVPVKETEEPVPADPEKAARIYQELGLRYLASGNHSGARIKLEKAVDIDDDLSESWLGLAMLAAIRADDGARDRHFQRALSASDDRASVYNQYGAFLCARGVNAEAIQQFEKSAALSGNKQPEVALSNAAQCARRNDDLLAATGYLDRALANNPEHLPSLLQNADVQTELGNFLLARGMLKRFESATLPTRESVALGMRLAARSGDAKSLKHYTDIAKQRFPELLSEGGSWQ